MKLAEHYSHHATLSLSGQILCISATEDGKVACGGTSGTQIWCLPGLEETYCPSAIGRRGATTALTWIRREDAPDDALVYGMQAGDLVVWKEKKGQILALEEISCVQLAQPAEITGLCFEPTSNRLVACNRSSVVQLFSVSSNMKLVNLFSVSLPNHIPKSVAFERVGHTHSVLTFGLYDGRIHSLRADTGEVETTLETGGMIGNAQLDPKRNVLCVDNVCEGVALYHLDTRSKIRTYNVPMTKSLRPRQVAFAEDCHKIIMGSDHGKVYVFERRKEGVVEELSIGSRAWVQSVIAVDFQGVPYIIAGKSQDDSEGGRLVVWKKVAGTREPKAEANKQWRPRLIDCVTFIAMIVFLYQNFWVVKLVMLLGTDKQKLDSTS